MADGRASLLLHFHHNTQFLFPINFYDQRFFKPDVAYIFIFVAGFELRKVIQIVNPIINKGIKRKITNPERGKVLEEVRALARVDAIILKARLNNEPCGRNLWPFYRNAQPGVS